MLKYFGVKCHVVCSELSMDESKGGMYGNCTIFSTFLGLTFQNNVRDKRNTKELLLKKKSSDDKTKLVFELHSCWLVPS